MKYSKTIKGILAGAVAAISMTPGVASAEAFNGPYAGVEAGLGILKSKGSTLAGPFEDKNESILIGAVAGVRVSLGENLPVVFGAEGGVGINTDGGDARYMVSGIGGLNIGGKALVYGRAGYAWNDELSNETDRGLVLGGGVELAFDDRVSARVEYRHIDYGEVTFPDNTVDHNGHEIMAGILFNF